MTDGTGSLPSLPDLKQPPAYVEGEGGGPAFPTGGTSSDDKQNYDDASDLANAEAAGAAVAAAGVLIAGPEAAPASIFFGVVSGVMWCVSVVFAELAEDPPQPYQHIVSIEPRSTCIPQTPNHALARVGIAWQYGVSSLVTARAYLNALERLAGAQQAQDLSWAITHWGVAMQCRQTLVVNLASTAAALYAAAQALKKSAYDYSLAAGGADIRKWIEAPGMEQKMGQQLAEAGLIPTESQAVIEWWKSNPAYSGSAGTLSAEFEGSSQALYSIAERLVISQ
jgi:hypothetical protein